jgi:hypothetical protein
MNSMFLAIYILFHWLLYPFMCVCMKSCPELFGAVKQMWDWIFTECVRLLTCLKGNCIPYSCINVITGFLEVYVFFCNIIRVFSSLTSCNLHTTENYFMPPRGMKEQKCCGLYQPLACYYRTTSFSCYVVLTEEVVLKCYCYAVLSDMPHLPSANNLNTFAVDGQYSVSVRPSVSRKWHRPPGTSWGHWCQAWDSDVSMMMIVIPVVTQCSLVDKFKRIVGTRYLHLG